MIMFQRNNNGICGVLGMICSGLAEFVWAPPGYTPGRYPKVAAFGLPFMASSAEATFQSLQEYYGNMRVMNSKMCMPVVPYRCQGFF